MGKLVYTGITSLDGYIADENGDFDWSEPDEEVHQFANDLERETGIHLYGRRLYEVMSWWETMPRDESHTEEARILNEYADLWRAAEKVVYSTTLDRASSERTRIERSFDPVAIELLKSGQSRPLYIGGADLAGQALAHGLVDEIRMLVSPVIVGGGTPLLPKGLKLDLELLTTRTFGNGVVYLAYRVGR